MSSELSSPTPNTWVKQIHDFGVNILNNTAFRGYKFLNNESSLEDFNDKKIAYDKNVKWYAHYLLLNLEMLGLCLAADVFLPVAASAVLSGATVGGVINGNSDCKVFKNFFNDKPQIATTVGMAVCTVFCGIMMAPMIFDLPFKHTTMIGSFLASWYLSSTQMCAAEQAVYQKFADSKETTDIIAVSQGNDGCPKSETPPLVRCCH
ncbi:MAG: hypothetical protein AAF153_03245 [Pseudomonadota bacterium]